MLLQIGQRPQTNDLVSLLVECHGRIRRFLDIAHELATTPGVPADEARAAAGQVRRYFTVAFPLHLADEEESIIPRLTGRSAELDRALAQTHDDHAEHAELIDRLVALCDTVVRDPQQLPATATELAATATRLTDVLEAHLRLEELHIFPALRELPEAERSTIHDEMRTRRDGAP